MCYLFICLLLVIDMRYGFPKLTNLNDIAYYEVVELRHVDRHGRNRRDLSSFDHIQKAYFEETTYTFFGHQRYFHLQIYKNRFLIPDNFASIHQNEDGTYQFESNTHRNCFYHGYLLNRKRSFATVSTCYGLKGVIHDEDEEEFVIEPHPINNNSVYNNLNSHRYILFKSKDVAKKGIKAVCGVKDPLQSRSHINYPIESNPFLLAHRANENRRLRRSNVDMKYVEVVVVLDNMQFKQHGFNISETQHRGFEIFNAVDYVYKTMNTRVAVVNMVVWNVFNMATVSESASETLGTFEKYTRDVLHGEMKLAFDNAQLISSQIWGSLVGLAGVGVICSHTSSAVNRDHNANPAITANTVAHELGHNIGFMHNTNSCACHKEPCVMSGSVPMRPCQSFTNCSRNEYLQRLARGDLPCLLDFPGKLFGKPKCGNGYVEEGEECDCGTKRDCKKLKLAKCCDFNTCKLRKSAQCATGSCCESCKFKIRGTLCRKRANKDCDLEEYCTGKSGKCPKNFHLIDGTSCKNDTAYCYQGACKTHASQCRMLWGKNATKADDACFSVNSWAGDAWGNCGKNLRDDYVKCRRKDNLCGKLQCTEKSRNEPLPKFPIIGHNKKMKPPVTARVGNKDIKCYFGVTSVSDDLQDPTITDAGVKCANNSICVDHKCTHFSTLSHLKPCSKQCFDNGGVCNSNGNCHCPKGKACPDCVLAGPGGSADAGQGCLLDVACESCLTTFTKVMLILCLVVIPLILLIAYILYRNRFRIRTCCSKDDRGTRRDTVCEDEWTTDQDFSPDYPAIKELSFQYEKDLSPDFPDEIGHNVSRPFISHFGSSSPSYINVPPSSSSYTNVPPPSSYTNVSPSSSYMKVPPSSSYTNVPPSSSYTNVPPSSSYTKVPPSSSYTKVPPSSSHINELSSPTYINVPPPPPYINVPPPIPARPSTLY